MKIAWIAVLLLISSAPALAQEPISEITQLVLSADAAPNSGALAVARGSDVFLYQLASPDAPPAVFTIDPDWGVIGLSPGGELLALPVACNTIHLVDTETSAVVAEIETDYPYCEPLQLVFSPDGEHAFLTHGRLYETDALLDEAGEDEADFIELAHGMRNTVTFSVDGSLLLYAASANRLIYIRDAESGELVTSFPREMALSYYTEYRTFAFSQDAQYVAGLVNSGPTSIFKVATGDIMRTYWADTETASLAVWFEGAEGETRVLHRGYSGVTYWRVFTEPDQTINDVAPTELQTEDVALAEFSLDGSLLVLVTADETIARHDGTDATFLRKVTLPQ